MLPNVVVPELLKYACREDAEDGIPAGAEAGFVLKHNPLRFSIPLVANKAILCA